MIQEPKLARVPIRTILTPLQEYVMDAALEYGIIAGGFAAFLYDPAKKANDLDLFVTGGWEHGQHVYNQLYQRLVNSLPLGWRAASQSSRLSNYDSKIHLQNLQITDYSRTDAKETLSLQMVTHDDKDRYHSREDVLGSFDFNVCKASVEDKDYLLVDEYFLKDIKANRLTWRPYPPKKSNNSDYGYRINKYVEEKGYDMTFGDLLTIFGLVEKKREFYGQLICYDEAMKTVKNENLKNFINFVRLMKNKDPEWNDTGEF